MSVRKVRKPCKEVPSPKVVGSNPVSGKAYQVNDVVEWILPQLGHPDHGLVGVREDVAFELEESETFKAAVKMHKRNSF